MGYNNKMRNNIGKEKQRVLVFINSEVGGAERMSVIIAKMLEDEFNIKYVILRNEKYKETTTSIVNFLSYDDEILFLSNTGHFDKLKKLYRVIKSQKPDIVFSSHYNINDKILFLRPLLRGIKFIIRAENSYSTFDNIKKYIIRHTYNKADVMITQTDEMRKDFIENGCLPESKIITLENPVDIETIEQKVKGQTSPYPEDGKKHVVAVGRFHPQKGYDFLVRSLAKIRETQKDVELYIIGSFLGQWQSEYEKIMRMSEQLRVKDFIHCLGFNDNPFVYVKYADCFVLSSRFEGLPNVLVESLYLKTPVAAFKCIPIIERMVRDGVDGYLAEKENSDSLATAISNALKMGRTSPVYSGATKEDFVNLFKES